MEEQSPPDKKGGGGQCLKDERFGDFDDDAPAVANVHFILELVFVSEAELTGLDVNIIRHNDKNPAEPRSRTERLKCHISHLHIHNCNGYSHTCSLLLLADINNVKVTHSSSQLQILPAPPNHQHLSFTSFSTSLAAELERFYSSSVIHPQLSCFTSQK